MERETFKYPNFDVEYTAEDLASVPPMTYDPYDRELVPLLYFSCPYKTTFEIEISRLKDQGPDKENSGAVEASVKLTELLDLYKEDRGAKWVTALEEIPSLIIKGLSYLQLKNTKQDSLVQLVDWTMQALNLQVALRQPIALNVRQGYRLEVESFLSSASFQRYKKRDKNYRTAGSEGDGHPREKESCSPGRESSPPSSPPLQQTPGRWLCFPSRPLKAQISLLRNQSSHLKQKSELTPAWLRNQQWLPGAF